MSWKQRLYASVPYLLVLLGAAGIAISEEIRYAIFALVGMWLLPSPLTQPNVSRETSGVHYHDYEETCDECQSKHVSRETSSEPIVSRKTTSDDVEFYRRTLAQASELPVPCPVMHGSADDHVLGCEGWTFPR